MKLKLLYLCLVVALALPLSIMAAPGDFPYPVYGKVTETATGYAIRYLPITLTVDGQDFTTTSDINGNYQIELTTQYIGKSALIGYKGHQESIVLSGTKLNYNISYTQAELTGWLIGSGLALGAALVSGYFYIKKTIAGKKLKRCSECTDTHYCPK
jgi:hypothetical protein